jgi:glycosyltransferase involved in cell wall biosynthesis
MILTIGIPVYNAQATIKNTLDSIIKQLKQNDSDLEILICDNCSTDDTTKIILEEYINQQPNFNIRYYKNKRNLGASQNIKAVLNNAKGDFIWLCGDDMLYDGAIQYLKQILTKNQDIAIVTARSDIYTDNFSQIIYSPKQTNNNQDILCHNQSDFLKHSQNSIFFISSIIIKKDKWNNIQDHIDFNSYYPQTDIAIKLTKTHKSYVIDKALIKENQIANYSNKSKILIAFDMMNVVHKNFEGENKSTKTPQYKIARNHIRRCLYKEKDIQNEEFVINNFLKYKIYKYEFYGYIIKFLNFFNSKYAIFFIKRILRIKKKNL